MEDIPLISPRMRDLSIATKTKSPRDPMEFLSRSWSVSALEVSKALAPSLPSCMASKFDNNSSGNTASKPEDVNAESEDNSGLSEKHSSFASSATSQLLLERIMSQSVSAKEKEVSPLTSGRLSHCSGSLNGTESPPISPVEEFDDIVKFFNKHNTLQPIFTGSRASVGNGCSTPCGAKSLGRWLKERKEKKKEETRAHNAQLHAAVSVAAVGAAVAAVAAATAASSAPRKNEQSAQTDMSIASAATLVAAQCVASAEAMGAEREHLASMLSSAVNVHSYDDVTTLTAAAATALRGASTLKARALKEVWNIATVMPVAVETGCKENSNKQQPPKSEHKTRPTIEDTFLDICNRDYLAIGSGLMKRTRKGDLHWKMVSVYIHKTGQVMLKMKSKHVARTITKKKKNVVLGILRNMPAWPERHLFHNGERLCYFGLETAARGVIEFECRDHREYEIWTRGITNLLSIVADRAQDSARLK